MPLESGVDGPALHANATAVDQAYLGEPVRASFGHVVRDDAVMSRGANVCRSSVSSIGTRCIIGGSPEY